LKIMISWNDAMNNFASNAMDTAVAMGGSQ
jgi:hypothetical protein